MTTEDKLREELAVERAAHDLTARQYMRLIGDINAAPPGPNDDDDDDDDESWYDDGYDDYDDYADYDEDGYDDDDDDIQNIGIGFHIVGTEMSPSEFSDSMVRRDAPLVIHGQTA